MTRVAWDVTTSKVLMVAKDLKEVTVHRVTTVHHRKISVVKALVVVAMVLQMK